MKLKQLLTNSRMSAFRECPRKEWIGSKHIVPDAPATALRVGGNFHDAMEMNDLKGMNAARNLLSTRYASPPSWVDCDEKLDDWGTEYYTVLALFECHEWRWSQHELEVVATEQEFRVPLDRGHGPHPDYDLGGKIDRIVRTPEGRVLLQEYKTTSYSIDSDAYWTALRYNTQINQYLVAARSLGHDVEGCLYDVTRKPTIRRRKNEEPEQFYKRLVEDITEVRPQYYFERAEIFRTDDQLDAYVEDVWNIGEAIKAAHASLPAPYRNPGACLQPFRCPFLNICDGSERFHDDNAEVPAGFIRIDTQHPELEMK